MEVLTRCLQSATHHANFRFHPLCKELKLVNLAFADDIMIFCKGHPASVRCLMNALHQFSSWSGLHANPEKSQVYMAVVTDACFHDILQLTGFQIGQFPFRYLGLQIFAKKWSISSCQILIDKVSKRIQSWKPRNLSYQGRLCLINSVLLSLHTYWATIFMIPEAVIKGIEQKCRTFLWAGTGHAQFHANIAWHTVCNKKNVGGLNVPNCHIWNAAAVGKQVWDLAAKKGILWVKWINSIYLKGQDFWLYSASTNCSWHWKQVIKTRDRFRNGYQNGIWLGTADGSYTVRSGYDFLKGHSQLFPLHRSIWNSLNVKKHCFIYWLAAHNRLSTMDILVFLQQSNHCCLCMEANETRDHLFFRCRWSKLLLDLCCQWLGLDSYQYKYVNWTRWHLRAFPNKVRAKCVYAIYAACIYHTWAERNARFFNNNSHHQDIIFSRIKKEIARRISFAYRDLKVLKNSSLITRISLEL